jgi:hypothetical protein
MREIDPRGVDRSSSTRDRMYAHAARQVPSRRGDLATRSGDKGATHARYMETRLTAKGMEPPRRAAESVALVGRTRSLL